MRCWSLVFSLRSCLKKTKSASMILFYAVLYFSFHSSFATIIIFVREKQEISHEFKHYPTSINRRTLKSFSNSCGRTNVKLWQIVEDELTTLLHVKSWPQSHARRSLFYLLFSQNWREKISGQTDFTRKYIEFKLMDTVRKRTSLILRNWEKRDCRKAWLPKTTKLTP